MSKWINCKNCNHEYSNELARCPSCGKLTPLSFPKVCGTVLVIAIIIIAIVGIVLGFTEKDYTVGGSKPTSFDINQSSSSTESKDDASSTQDSFKFEISNNDDSQRTTESSNDKPSSNPSTTTSSVENGKTSTSTVTKPPEQKPTNQIPQDEVNGVKTADISLPNFYDATEGLKHCRDWYRPLSFIFLTYGMDEMVMDYNEQFNGDYILEVGGDGIEKKMTYRYRIRFDFADVSGAKAKFEKHLDDNTAFFNSQLALYKEYSPDVTGIQVIFEHDESNQTVASKSFK